MKKAWLTGILMLAVSPLAFSHTIGVGTVNAGTTGSVTIWLGSYHSPTFALNEGSMTLNGVTQAFNLISTVLPAGLTVGTNYFYAPRFGGATGTFDQPTNTTGLTERTWQGVTFTGLAAGTYTYAITGMNTVNWSDWNSSRPNWTGSLFIPRSSVATVPEPGSLALFGLGLLGLGMARRRRSA